MEGVWDTYNGCAGSRSNFRKTWEKPRRSSAQARLFGVSTEHEKVSVIGEGSLDSQAHARAARKGHKPVVKVIGLEPALWYEVCRFGEFGGVVMDKCASTRNVGLRSKSVDHPIQSRAKAYPRGYSDSSDHSTR